MRIVKTAPRVIKRPTVIVRPPTKHSIEAAKEAITSEKTSADLVVKIVKTDDGFVAIDNFEVLEAARQLKLESINALDVGKGDPLFMHIKNESKKDDINPARLAIAVRQMAAGKPLDDAVKKIGLNRSLNAIIQTELDDPTWNSLAKTIDDIFNLGVVSMPGAPFFDVVAKLDKTQSDEFMSKLVDTCKALKARHFMWPDRHIYRSMMATGKSERKVSESITRGVTRFTCKKCGTSYGIMNGKVHDLKMVNGCFVTGDEKGEKFFPIPPEDIKYISTGETEKPRFTHHKVTEKGDTATLIAEIISKMEPGERFLVVRSSKPRKKSSRAKK